MTWPPEWTDDCQGKKDYDADIVRLSTRYWPRGGGFSVYDSKHPEKGLQTNVLDCKPSAKASIVLDTEEFGNHDLIEKEFEGETEADVKRQVEVWAEQQYARISVAIRKEFHGG